MMRIFLFLLAVLFAHRVYASPIYVFKERDGTIRFTNKAPPKGVEAKVFTAKKSGFSYYRGLSSRRRSRLFRKEYNDLIHSLSQEHALDPSLVRAVIHVESGFNPRAVSPKGAMGLMQLMPQVAKLRGVKSPFDPVQNIQGGVKHLAFLLRKYNGNVNLALAAYNAGEDAVERARGIPPYAETREYVKRVTEMRKLYSVPG